MAKRMFQNLSRLLLLTCTVALSGVWMAEVSTDRPSNGRRAGTLMMDLRDTTGMTDGADPIPNLRWDQHREISRDRVLNSDGALRNDGRPDVAFTPFDFQPVVVWAWNHQTDHDIAFAEWTGEEWTEATFITNDADLDQVDPRVFVDRSRGVHVVWAVSGDDPHIMYARRGNGGEWRTPVRVSVPGEIVSRPSVATIGTVLAVAYEQVWSHAGTPRRSIVVRHLNASQDDGQESFDFDTVFHVPLQTDADPILHVRGGRLWIDWKHTDGFFAWSSYDNRQWSQVRLYPWLDPSWVGAEKRSSFHRASLLEHEDRRVEARASCKFPGGQLPIGSAQSAYARTESPIPRGLQCLWLQWRCRCDPLRSFSVR